ncbi:MAG: GspH/FimT family pseudopilin [Halomonas sp.]|nr:GspH/FimT family pseudopilin [Halomonas sp.]MCC5884260.1 GspH/FimT family pseudopilin [Halomonas sp.]
MEAANASNRAASHQRGLTLIELLIVIAVASLLMGWAVPGLQAMSARQEVAAEAHRLRVALSLGRNTAITRRSAVIVCPSPDRLSCNMDDWSAPLAIVLDPLAGNAFSPDALLRVVEGGRGVSVSYRQDGKPVRYGMLGRSSGHNGTFRICGRHGQGTELVLSNFGRVRAGSAISC